MRSTEEILENVVWLISQFDDDALEEVQDLPFLEIAKDIAITWPVSPASCLDTLCVAGNGGDPYRGDTKKRGK